MAQLKDNIDKLNIYLTEEQIASVKSFIVKLEVQ